MYSAVAAALSARAGRTLEHQTYKQLCGEFHAASAFGFSVAVDLVREGSRGVLALHAVAARRESDMLRAAMTGFTSSWRSRAAWGHGAGAGQRGAFWWRAAPRVRGHIGLGVDVSAD